MTYLFKLLYASDMYAMYSCNFNDYERIFANNYRKKLLKNV